MKAKELTAEQEAKLSEYRDKWLAIGLSTERADRKRAQEGAIEAYAAVGLPPPKTFIWLPSPLHGAICAALLMDENEETLRGMLGGKSWSDEAALVSIVNRVVEFLNGRSPDWRRDDGGLFSAILSHAGNQVSHACYGQHDANWLGFYDFFDRELNLECTKKLRGLMTAAESAGWFWPFDDAVVFTERPVSISRDTEYRLHCATGPALKYCPDFKIYAWHGVRVPAQWIEAPGEVDPSLALTTANIEQRTALAQIIGWEKIIDLLNPTIIDKDPDPAIGTLLEVDLPSSPKSRFLKVVGPGAHGPEGVYVIGVSRDWKTAREANARSYGVTAEQFNPKVRT